jgi:hypothetical protein
MIESKPAMRALRNVPGGALALPRTGCIWMTLRLRIDRPATVWSSNGRG